MSIHPSSGWGAALWLLLSTPTSAAAGPLGEGELVARYLSTPAAKSALSAASAESHAQRTPVPLVRDPAVDARHEQPGGTEGGSTDALGGHLTLDLGLSSLSESGAARLRGEAAEAQRTSLAVDAVCGLRRESTDLWAAAASAEVAEAAQSRLGQLLDTLGALVEAGEAAGFDRDLTGLAVSAHASGVAQSVGQHRAVQAALSSLLGEPVSAVVLDDLPPLAPLDELGSTEPPELAAKRLQRDAETKALSGARRTLIPDLELSAARRWDRDTTGTAEAGFELGGSVVLPLWSGARHDIRDADARHARAEAELAQTQLHSAGAIEGAWQRAAALDAPLPDQVDPEALWAAAQERYTVGETSLEALLQVAEAVEQASLATIDHERQRRHARLNLECARGTFDNPTIQAALLEALR